MTDEQILQALKRLRVETGSLACFGCGREHNCGTHGCAILRQATDLIERLTAERDELLEIAKRGKACETCKNNNSVCEQHTVTRCDMCAGKCLCYGCEGQHWEWRGLPEAPEEGEFEMEGKKDG